MGDAAHPEVTDDEDNVVAPCYAQPVPNTVAVGPDGAMYAGELTGLAEGAPFGAPVGVSRVWRIEPGTTDAICPSAECEVVLNGFTSIIDIGRRWPGGAWPTRPGSASAWWGTSASPTGRHARVLLSLDAAGIHVEVDLDGRVATLTFSPDTLLSALAFNEPLEGLGPASIRWRSRTRSPRPPPSPRPIRFA